MKFFIFLAMAAVALSSPVEKIKGLRASIFNLPANAKVKLEDAEQFVRLQNDDYDDVEIEPVGGESRQVEATDSGVTGIPIESLKSDTSNGRLFLKKLLLFGNSFGGGGGSSQSSQPIIIVVPGNGSGGGNTATTQTVTTTGTIDGTGTVTTQEQRAADPAGEYMIGEEDVYEDQTFNDKANANANANAKSSKRQNIIKLQQGAGKQQSISFLVPPKYMRYLKNNGNAVVLNPVKYNNGGYKVQKLQLSNSGNVKRKRSKNGVRRLVAQQ